MLSGIFYDKPLPDNTLPYNPKVITDMIIARVSTIAGIVRQQGFLCDLLVISKSIETGYYYQDLPIDYIRESDFSNNDHYYTITIEFSPINGELLIMDLEKAELDIILHPIIRRLSGKSVLREYHITKNLENINKFNYNQLKTSYTQKILDFFEKETVFEEIKDLMRIINSQTK